MQQHRVGTCGPRFAAVLVAIVASTWACGGAVTISGHDEGAEGALPGGTGGANGAGVPTGGTHSAGGTGTTGWGAGGTGPSMAAAMCGEVCALVEPCEAFPHCQQHCVQNIDLTCWPVYYSVLLCATNALDPLFEPVDPLSCGLPPECFDEAEQWTTCKYGPAAAPDASCGAPACWQDDAWLGCTAPCADDTYATECMPGIPLYHCMCLVNDVAVGSCSDQGPDLADPLLGCCGSLFFGDEWW